MMKELKTVEDVAKVRQKYAYYGEDKNINENTAVYHIRQLLNFIEARIDNSTETE